MQQAKMSMSEEEFKQLQKMKRLEAEAQEEVNHNKSVIICWHSCLY